MREHALPCAHQRPLIPLSCSPSDVRSGQSSHGGIAQRLPSDCVLRHLDGFHHAPQDDISPRVRGSARTLLCPPIDIYLSTDSLSGTKCPISPRFHPSSESQQSTRCLPSGPRYSRSFVTHIQRLSRGWGPQNLLEKASLADGLLIRTRSSTSSFSRTSRPRYQWHTIWRLDEV